MAVTVAHVRSLGNWHGRRWGIGGACWSTYRSATVKAGYNRRTRQVSQLKTSDQVT